MHAGRRPPTANAAETGTLSLAPFFGTDYTRTRMRYILSFIVFFLAVSISSAVSLEEVVKLTLLKTSDDVIVDLILKTGVDQPLTVADVVYLKEQNVSDRVISHLLTAGKSRAKTSSSRPQKLPENMRAYYTTNEDGKRVRVVTNIDEKGKRMGGDLPPEKRAQPPTPPASYSEPSGPREIRVIVQQEPLVRREQEQDVVYDGSDRYGPPTPSAIPLYGGYDPFYPPVYPGGYPLFPLLPNGPCHKCKGFSPNQPSWHVDAGYGRTRKQPRGKHVDASRPHSQGTRRNPK